MNAFCFVNVRYAHFSFFLCFFYIILGEIKDRCSGFQSCVSVYPR
jgi:hypothetical protein